jgi:hypothetical protein
MSENLFIYLSEPGSIYPCKVYGYLLEFAKPGDFLGEGDFLGDGDLLLNSKAFSFLSYFRTDCLAGVVN